MSYGCLCLSFESSRSEPGLSRFGLSYTSFLFSSLKVTSLNSAGEFSLGISLSVTNTGDVAGSEVVQVYITLPAGCPTTPEYQLRTFRKVRDLKSGDTREVHVKLDKYAVSYWDVNGVEGRKTGVWRVKEGIYRIAIGSSSIDHRLNSEFEVKDGFVWEGL